MIPWGKMMMPVLHLPPPAMKDSSTQTTGMITGDKLITSRLKGANNCNFPAASRSTHRKSFVMQNGVIFPLASAKRLFAEKEETNRAPIKRLLLLS